MKNSIRAALFSTSASVSGFTGFTTSSDSVDNG